MRFLFSLALGMLVGAGSLGWAAPDKLASRPAVAATTGRISGVVADPTGAAIPQAVVTAVRVGHPPVKTTSDEEGHYSLEGLEPGSYLLEATEAGFDPAHIENVDVKAGADMAMPLTLSIAGNTESVTVSADDAAEVSTENNADAVSLKGDNLDALSDDPDELSTQLQAIAGADGDTGSQMFVDGFSGGQLPPKNSIREIRINENPYSAQYDQMGWGRIEIFTKPGADRLHGSFWMQGNTSALNAPNPLLTSQPPYHRWQLSADVNGPASTSSSYFMSFWTRRTQSNAIISAEVLDDALNPVSLNQAVSTSSSGVSVTPRYDWQWGKLHTLTARYLHAGGSSKNGGAGQFTLASRTTNSSWSANVVQLSDTMAFNENLMDEVHFQYNHSHSSFTPISTDAAINVQGAFNGGGSANNGGHDTTDNFELWNLLRWTHDKHNMIFGGRVRGMVEENYSTGNYNGSWTFTSLDAYRITLQNLRNCEQKLPDCMTPDEVRAAGGGASLFSQSKGTPTISIGNSDWDGYAEDNWKMRPNVTLGYGLRFESQSGIPDKADFAPRVSFAWAIGGEMPSMGPGIGQGKDDGGKKKNPHVIIRGGGGLFYSRFPTGGLMQVKRQDGKTQSAVVVRNPDFFPDTCVTDPEACAEGDTSEVAPTIYTLSPDLRSPFVAIYGAGADKPLGKRAKVSVNYAHIEGVHQFVARNVNAPLPGTYDPNDPTSGVRPLGTNENIYEYGSEGSSSRDRVNFSANYNSRRGGFWGYVTLSKAEANTAGFGSFPSNQYDQDADWGRTGWNSRSRGAFGGYAHLPYGIGLNPFVIFETSNPFNIVVNQDLNGDTIYNDRPTFATDLTRPSVYHTKWGDFDSDPLPGQEIIPINYGDGPGEFVVNLSLNKRFRFGPALPDEEQPKPDPDAKKPEKLEVARRYSLYFSMKAENLTNHPNYSSPVGVLGSSLFGTSTALNSPGGSNPDRAINFETSFHF